MYGHASTAMDVDGHPSAAALRRIPLVGEQLDAFRTLSREFGVTRLEVFGSVMTDAFDHVRSDIDFIVTYPEGYDLGPLYRRHFALQRALAKTIGHCVELVEASSLDDPCFAAIARETRCLVYAAENPGDSGR